MSNIAFVRMQRECSEIMLDKKDSESTGIAIEMLNDQLSRIKGTINGPPDSPYEGGKFDLDIVIPETYPFHPPKIKFATRIWHPNVNSLSGFCDAISHDEWAVSLTLRTVLLSIQLLLAHYESRMVPPPENAAIFKQKWNDPKLFDRTARFWTQHYAKGDGQKDAEFVHKINKLKEMGVNEDLCISTLSGCGWDLATATSSLRKHFGFSS